MNIMELRAIGELVGPWAHVFVPSIDLHADLIQQLH
jgi:hypothetical protein